MDPGNQPPGQSSSDPQPPSSPCMSPEPGTNALPSQNGHVTPEMMLLSIHYPDQYAFLQQFQNQPQPAYINPQDFQHAPAPPSQYQYHPQMGNPSYSYDVSPLESTTPGFVHQSQVHMGMPPAFMPIAFDGSYPYMGQHQPEFAWPNSSSGPARSRGLSPASSVTSSAVSVVRSASTSSDLRPKARPKTKLQFEDKANIVRIHKNDNSLRQEDIAQMYGSVKSLPIVAPRRSVSSE